MDTPPAGAPGSAMEWTASMSVVAGACDPTAPQPTAVIDRSRMNRRAPAGFIVPPSRAPGRYSVEVDRTPGDRQSCRATRPGPDPFGHLKLNHLGWVPGWGDTALPEC